MRFKKFQIFRHRELLILGIALGFLFFGWNAAEQHLTSFFQETEGQVATGLNSLAVLYGSIIIGNFLAPLLVKKLGIKPSIILGFVTFILLILGIVTKITPLILVLSAFLGVGGALSGVAQIDMIRIFSLKNLRGELAGSVNAIRAFGGGLGILSVGFLLMILKIEAIYLILGIIMTAGTLILFFIKMPRGAKIERTEEPLQAIQKTVLMFKEPKLLLTIPLSVANGFLLGLVLGVIPASITQTYGIKYVGLTTPLFHFALAFSGFYSGRLSDKKGRFLALYPSIIFGIAAALIIIFTNRIWPMIFAMLFAGFFSATSGVVMSALFIDLFGKKVKEAQAAGGAIGAALGVIPAFVLGKYFSTVQLLYLAIFLCLLGGFSLRILEFKQKALRAPAEVS